MSFLRQSLVIAAKDLRSEYRTKEAINASASFALLMLVLFSFAFDATADATREISGGLLWLVFTFAGALLLNRSFARELPQDCLDMLRAAPIPAAALFLGKVLANFVLLAGIEALALPIYGIFFNKPWYNQLPLLSLVCGLATWGITVVGTAFSALTVNLRMREVMLPVLLYPLLMPLLMGAIQLTIPLAIGEPASNEVLPYLRLITAFDIIFTVLCFVLIETILEG